MKKIVWLLIISITAVAFIACSNDQGKVENKEELFANLKTNDIGGKEFTTENFKESDITLINVWSTICSPCIAEMPVLEELSKEYKDKGVSIKGVIIESGESGMMEGLSKEEEKLALEIIEKTNANYQQLLVSKSLLETDFKRIMELPTTFFVDKEGNIVGEKVTGANDKQGWKKIIEERLQMVK